MGVWSTSGKQDVFVQAQLLLCLLPKCFVLLEGSYPGQLTRQINSCGSLQQGWAVTGGRELGLCYSLLSARALYNRLMANKIF